MPTLNVAFSLPTCPVVWVLVLIYSLWTPQGRADDSAVDATSWKSVPVEGRITPLKGREESGREELPSAARPTPNSKQRRGSRLSYLDDRDPYWVGLESPRLTTPMWVGEEGVEAAIVLSIDDMRDPEHYERYLRPLLNSLQSMAGRAPVSIFTCRVPPDSERLRQFLREGLTFEIHTVSHPCPLMRVPLAPVPDPGAGEHKTSEPIVGDGQALMPGDRSLRLVLDDYLPCIENMSEIPGNRPVAFRMPCCDSLNTNSPRFYSEVLARRTRAGQFLSVSSSVFMMFTAADAELKREWVVDADGRDKFKKYVPFHNFANLIENYPYPYVVGGTVWEFPGVVPTDWSAQHLRGVNHPGTVEDWECAVDATVRKQGLFTLVFHPHQWIKPEQLAELATKAFSRHGDRVRFLNFRDVSERLTKNLLGGEPLRAEDGGDNGVRLLDVNGDGYMDVLVGNTRVCKTRVWRPVKRAWRETTFPMPLVDDEGRPTGVRFFLEPSGNAACLVSQEAHAGVWRFDGREWVSWDLSLPEEVDGISFRTCLDGVDQGVRVRDIDGDGMDDLIVGNASQNAVFLWDRVENGWKRARFALPGSARFVDARGRDAGLRFRDLDGDGDEDIVFANEREFLVATFSNQQEGWTIVKEGKLADPGAVLAGSVEMPVPMIAHDGRSMGAWFFGDAMFVANEYTAKRKDLVEKRTFRELRTPSAQ